MGVTGRWVPGGFPPVITLAAKLTLFGSMLIRGADYFFGDSPDTARRLSTIEAAAPLHWWGLLFALAAGIGFTGIALRRANMVLWGHITGAALYLSLSVGIVIDVYQRSDDPDVAFIPSFVLFAISGLALASSLRSRRRLYASIVLAAFTLTASIAIVTIGMDGLRNASILTANATLHLLMAIGTAARQRQESILEARKCE